MVSVWSDKICFLILAGLLIGLKPALLAQRLPTPDALTVDDGLCFRHVTAITQDKNGLIWIGTQNGLSRYDGYRFINFGEKTETDKYFPALAFAQNGIIFRNDSIFWAIVDSKLWAMNIRNFETRAIPGVEGKVLKMMGGKNEDIWLVSDNNTEQFLWHFTEKNGFEKISSSPHNRLDLTAINVDTSGGVWWSTITNGLQQFSPTGKLMSEAKIDSFFWHGTTMYYNDIFIDSRNRFFVYSMNQTGNHQIWQYFPESGKKKVISGGMKDIQFMAAEDSEGNIWFTKEEGLLQMQPDGYFNDYSEVVGQALDFTKIFSIFEDRTNTLWFGTDGGLLKLPVRKQFFDTYFSRKNMGWGNAMRGICEGPNDDIFFFCEIGDIGLYRMDKNTGKVERLSFGMTETDYISMLELANYFIFDQKRNCLWTMTDKLLKIDLKTQKIIPQPAITFGREFSSFNPLALLPDGQVLFGNSLDKLSLFDPESGVVNHLFRNNSQAYADIYPKTFLVQGTDSIWVGTYSKGLYLFNRNGDLLKHYNKNSQPALSNNHVLSLFLDKQDNLIWAGTFGGGMCSIELATGKLRFFNQQNGLPDKNVVSIIGDGDNLWLGTYNGLTCFNKKGETFRSFYTEDGLSHNEFNFSSALRCDDGQMYFGGMNGINAFYPKDLLQQVPNPPLQLTRFTKYDLRADSLIDVQLDGNLQQTINISNNISFFTFEWTLPNYLNPDKNQYFTWMEGLDEDWTYLGNTPRIRFNKLPPGKYTLHLKGKDSRGNWSESPIELKINIITPWWKRWWAFGLYFMLMATVIIFLRKRELDRIHLQNELEKEQSEALRLWELEQVKTRFFSNLSHEFRTPLTVILGMSEEIREPKTAKHTIQRSSQNLLRLVNQMLDFNKLEAGKLNLELQSGDLVAYLQYLVESFQSLAAHKNVRLIYEPAIEQFEVDFDEAKIQHIVSNLLSNAIKFTPPGGKVTLEIRKLEIEGVQFPISISVSDTGIGIPAMHLSRIFERYFQVGDAISKGEPGTGIGLAFTKELVELMDGNIEVESEVGVGSVFRVLLPLAKTADLTVSDLALAGAEKIQLPENGMAAPVEPSSPENKRVNKHTVLVIEDNPEVVTYMLTLLEREYEVTVAENGEIGIAKAVHQIPDIIISDVMMPVKDGFAVTRFLKNDERTSHIPIVLLTAKADAESRLAGLERGADAYLAKPFDKKELLVRLEQLIALRKKLQARYARFEQPQPTEDIALSIEDKFLQKVNDIIEANLDDAEFNVNELCQAVGHSRPQLFRKIKALTDKSIVAYLRSARLHKARQLLQTGELNISEVAYRVGFNDPLYFSRAFSQEFGCPPTELLK